MKNSSAMPMIKAAALLLASLGLPGLVACGLVTVETGENQRAVAGQTVTLSGEATLSSASSTVRYSWTQLAGPPVDLVNANSPQLSFVAPPVAETKPLIFELTVSSRVGSTNIFAKDLVTVLVEPAPDPTAEAGPDQTVSAGADVTLEGQGDAGPDEAATFTWEQVDGPEVELTGTDVEQPSFVAPVVEDITELVFELTVQGLAGKAARDTVTVTVEPALPVARAGYDQVAFEGQTVTLDPSGSTDPSGGSLVFLWEQIGGLEVDLLVTEQQVSFEVPEVEEPEVLTFELIVVAEPQLTTSSDLVEITLQPYPKPAADAGQDLVVEEGRTVILDGTASKDPAGDALTYSWTISGAVTLTSPNASQSVFVAPSVDGPTPFTATLSVTNVKGQQSIDTVIVTVIDGQE